MENEILLYYVNLLRVVLKRRKYFAIVKIKQTIEGENIDMTKTRI